MLRMSEVNAVDHQAMQHMLTEGVVDWVGFGEQLSTGQNIQGPQERLELFSEVQDDVAEKVESVAEQGLEWPLECFFNRMGCCS